MAKKTQKTENVCTTEDCTNKEYYFTAHVNFSWKMYNAGQKYSITQQEALHLKKYIVCHQEKECIPCKAKKQ